MAREAWVFLRHFDHDLKKQKVPESMPNYAGQKRCFLQAAKAQSKPRLGAPQKQMLDIKTPTRKTRVGVECT
jgi:hypothetical protein